MSTFWISLLFGKATFFDLWVESNQLEYADLLLGLNGPHNHLQDVY
jgi:hypothetical protein